MRFYFIILCTLVAIWFDFASSLQIILIRYALFVKLNIPVTFFLFFFSVLCLSQYVPIFKKIKSNLQKIYTQFCIIYWMMLPDLCVIRWTRWTVCFHCPLYILCNWGRPQPAFNLLSLSDNALIIHHIWLQTFSIIFYSFFPFPSFFSF